MPIGAPPLDGHWSSDPATVHKSVQDMVGGPTLPTPDVAFVPPVEPDWSSLQTRERASLVYREIPLTAVANVWTVGATRAALMGMTAGVFEMVGTLVDGILGDDRVQATLGSRVGGLLGAPVRFTPSEDDTDRKVFDAWVKYWPQIGAEAPWNTMLSYGHMLAFQHAQLLWDTQSSDLWIPHLMPVHPSFTYYHWPLRKYVFVSLDGQVAIQPGDGKWVTFAPFGEYRGWMRGAVRAIAQPWLMRHFALRDWARFNERHGLPILKGKVPAAADPQSRAYYEAQIKRLGTDTAMILPQGVSEQFSYDLELLEAVGGEWESFKGEIDQCDMQIVLTLLYQNLTTEVQEGSFAAARVHAAVRQAALKSDSRALAMTIYHQIARPFAAFNFGDPDLAPWSEWEVTPSEDFNANADVLVKWANAFELLRRAGLEITDKEGVKEFAKHFGLTMPDFNIVEPAQPGTASGGTNAEPKGTDGKKKPTESQRKVAGDGD